MENTDKNPFEELEVAMEPSKDGSQKVINRVNQLRLLAEVCSHFSIGMVQVFGELIFPESVNGKESDISDFPSSED